MANPILRSVVTGLVLVTGACSSVDGQGIYATKSIGNVARSVTAVVVSAKAISVREARNYGSTYGALAGGALASGSDDGGVILVGILAGAVVGSLVEDAANTQAATLYSLKSANGAVLQVAQLNKDGVLLAVGDTVRVEYGYPNRLVREGRAD